LRYYFSRGFRFKGESGTLNKDIAEIERMLKALIKSLENKPCFACGYAGHALEPLTPGILGPSSSTKLEKNLNLNVSDSLKNKEMVK